MPGHLPERQYRHILHYGRHAAMMLRAQRDIEILRFRPLTRLAMRKRLEIR